MQQNLVKTTQLLLMLIFLIGTVESVFQMANYPLMKSIKSGDHKLLTLSTNGTKQFNYTQEYFLSFFPRVPVVVITIRDMQIANTSASGSVDYTCKIINITSTQFITNLKITGGNTFSLLYYMYLGLDPALVSFTYFNGYTFDLTGQFNDTTGVVQLRNNTIANSVVDYTRAVVVPFVMSFGMNTTSQFSFFVTASMKNQTVTQVNITSNSKLFRMEMTVIVVDKTKLEANYTYFIDVGTTITTKPGSAPVSTYSPPSSNYFNFIIGLGSLRVDKSQDINFFFYTNNSFLSFTDFKYLSHYSLQWRQRQCINTSAANKFVLQKQLCYDICPSGYNSSTSTDYCVKCNYTCATCLVDGVTCTSCPSDSGRTLPSLCGCIGGFYDNGNVSCAACHISCLTCGTSQTNCLSCNITTRNFTNNTCPCLTGYFQQNSAACASCDYTCLTCVGSSTNCTSCDQTNNFRYYDSTRNTCTCKSGFEENGNGNAKCIKSSLQCTSPCQTCIKNKTNCLSCLANRTLTNNACPCRSGFTAQSDFFPCYEACGTGQMVQGSGKECDDGDIMAGDGCSQNCTEQENFQCDKTAMPSVCISTKGYSFSTQSVSKDLTSNTLRVVLTVSPIPPKSSEPSLLNLQDWLSLISYSLDRSILTLRLNLIKALDNESQLKVQLSTINSIATVSLASQGNVQLIPYVDSYYTLYNIEVVLVWVYIGALWALAIYRIVTEPTMISQVCQVYIYTSLVWIGVQGLKNPMLLFVPIKNLRYLYGYNLQLNNSSLFSVFNISFGYLAIPLLIFVVMTVISKKSSISVPMRIKRFVIYDLTYAWVVANGFLLAYGTSLTVTSSNSLSGIDIAGIMVFVLYLLVMSAVSYKSFFKRQEDQQMNSALENTKKNLFKQKIYPVYMLLSVLMSFIYLVLQRYTEINSLFMIGYFLVLMVVFGIGNVFINKVRNLVNLINLLLIYCCYLLINQVSSATWTGFAVISLLFIQLITNFVIIYFQKGNLRVDSDDDLLKDKVKVQPNFDQTPQNLEISERGVIELEEHVGAFTIYEPQTSKKDQLQIMIPPPQYFIQSPSILATPLDIIADRERITDIKQALNQYLLSSPKYKGDTELKKEEPQELDDIANKEVKMNEF